MEPGQPGDRGPGPSIAWLSVPDGEVVRDEATLAFAAQDFGHLVHRRPAAVVRPVSLADLTAVMTFAGEHGLPVSARGAGHSPFGQEQAEGGIVLDMRTMPTVREVDGETAVVDAGAHWREVLDLTLPHGLTPPVLTDYLELTVGGTLVVGGIGGAAHHHGTQTDNVLELEVVTGTGEVVTCGPGSDLFDAVRGGLGLCGVITKARLRLVPAPPTARRWKLYYRSLDTFLADQRTVVRDGRFDYLEGQLLLDEGEWTYLLEAVTYSTASLDDLRFERMEVEDSTYFDFLNRMAEGEAALRAEGSWFHPHPWLNVFLPDEVVGRVVADTLATTRREDLGGTGLVMLYPVRASALNTPLLRVPAGELVWLFSLLRTGKPADPIENARLTTLNIRLYQQAKALGGTVYPSNSLPMTPADWADQFGPVWDALTTARHLHDPHTLFGSGNSLRPPPP
ncbi:FAD-binding protein [Amycolatopsis magusensis]|uniref:FAD/FMN-containing dehydrogenase n=1 Tax=Amycolatopsis magusensis TaxID=882444 RepID=A0ABS4PS50_9PSEU|nr:FAD-binding protein [Amycolatopsis magusensis]MBP2181436.1 FAD/FMN-containing dehydrogenase [Amycolatopsis magusensis]